MARPPSERENTSTLAWTGFYCFLIAYIKEGFHSLCSGLLQVITFTDNKGKDVTDYFLQINKEKCCKCKGMIRVIGLITLCPWENQHRLQEVTLKICSKHLQLQFRVREFQQKQASKQPRYNAGLVSHRKADLWIWLLCADLRLPVFQQDWATFAIAKQTSSL